MTDHDAFLRAIVEYPHDLRPRLVFADWLDENATDTNGYSEQAEFIRLMCDGHPADDPNADDAVAGRLIQLRYHGQLWSDIDTRWTRHGFLNAPTPVLPVGLIGGGFIQEIRCPLSWWIGGECECFTNEPDAHCPTCHGTGRTPANGPAVVSRQPVTRVEISDREPHQRPNGSWLWFRWFGTTIPHPPAELPLCLFEVAALLDVFPTREAAVEVLSRALVDWAREQAGLTPIKWEVSQ